MDKTTFKNENTISILGCGWLGLPLAKYFVDKSFCIRGSVASEEKYLTLKKSGIIPYRVYLNPDINKDFDAEFLNAEILIINFPPKRRDDIEEFHPQQFKSLVEEIKKSPIKKVLLVSSTSVYANTNDVVRETNTDTPEKSSGKALRTVEEMLLQEQSFTTTIIRFGGLIGYDRKPGRFFANKKRVKDGEAPVNLIHQDDCIGIIHHIIENQLWGETFNACCPEHPKRKDFYVAAAKKGGFEIPEFSDSKMNFKIISSDKIINQFGYKFKYNNPIDTL